MQDALFVLLRNELWQEGRIDVTLSDEEKERLFANAKKQAVIGLVANALIRNNATIGREWAFKALTLTKQIETTNERINGELVRFANFMFKHNVDYRDRSCRKGTRNNRIHNRNLHICDHDNHRGR